MVNTLIPVLERCAWGYCPNQEGSRSKENREVEEKKKQHILKSWTLEDSFLREIGKDFPLKG